MTQQLFGQPCDHQTPILIANQDALRTHQRSNNTATRVDSDLITQPPTPTHTLNPML